jgi:hypothetical protein
VSWTFFGAVLAVMVIVTSAFLVAQRLGVLPRRTPAEAALSRAERRAIGVALRKGQAVDDPRLVPIARERAIRSVESAERLSGRGYTRLYVGLGVTFLAIAALNLFDSDQGLPSFLSFMLIAATWFLNPALNRRQLAAARRAEAANSLLGSEPQGNRTTAR